MDWSAATIGGYNINNGPIAINPANPTEIESKYTSSVFPRFQAYKIAKNHQKKVPYNCDLSTSSVVITDDERPETKSKIKKSTRPPSDKGSNNKKDDTSFEPYMSKLERFEFFAALQAYLLLHVISKTLNIRSYIWTKHKWKLAVIAVQVLILLPRIPPQQKL
jgi:hypothetical protein